MQKLLELALSSYNEGMVEGHLRNLQNLMKILDCPKKEVYIIKSDGGFEGNAETRNYYMREQHNKVNELLSSMTVNEPDDAILSNDQPFNKMLHLMKSQNNIMKLSIGKDDSKLTVYIKGIFNKPQIESKEDDHSERKADESQVKKPPRIPWHLLRTHLFPYFTAVELFKLRLVSQQWKTIISGMWHSIFKREMYTQFLMTNFTREIEKNFKLLSVRQPIAKKFFVYATTLSEMIKWDEVIDLCNQETPFQKKAKLLVVTMMKLMDYKSVPIPKLSEFDAVTWFQVESLLPENFKERVQAFLADGNLYPSVWDMEK